MPQNAVGTFDPNAQLVLTQVDCGNAISNGAIVAPGGISECNMLCKGNSSEYCGAGNRLDVYKFGYEGVSSSAVASSTRVRRHENGAISRY